MAPTVKSLPLSQTLMLPSFMTTEYVAGRSQSYEGSIRMRRALRFAWIGRLYFVATRNLTVGSIGMYEG